MNFDVLIIGGGVAGMSAALVLGSAKNKPFAENKRIGIIMHQKTSALNGALFNNVLGITPGTTGKELLENGRKQLAETYPHVVQIEKEKALETAGYIAAKIDVTKEIKVDAGLRYSLYNALGAGTQNVYAPGAPRTEASITEVRNFENNEIIYVVNFQALFLSQLGMKLNKLCSILNSSACSTKLRLYLKK